MRGRILAVLLLGSLAIAQFIPERHIVVKHRVAPQYPMIAKQARITGTVVIKVVKNGDTTMDQYLVVSGHPMLVNSAIDAVKQWEIVCEDCVYPEPYEYTVVVRYSIGGW
jgi:protein TonB